VTTTCSVPEGTFEIGKIKEALEPRLGSHYSWGEAPLYLFDNGSIFSIKTKIIDLNVNKELDYNVSHITYRFGPAGNCGMVEISLYGGISYFEKYFLDFVEYQCRSYTRSVIIGNDRIGGRTWDLVTSGENWNFQECTWNINYQSPSHKIGLFWKNIALYEYSGDKFGIPGTYNACNPDNGRL